MAFRRFLEEDGEALLSELSHVADAFLCGLAHREFPGLAPSSPHISIHTHTLQNSYFNGLAPSSEGCWRRRRGFEPSIELYNPITV